MSALNAIRLQANLWEIKAALNEKGLAQLHASSKSAVYYTGTLMGKLRRQVARIKRKLRPTTQMPSQAEALAHILTTMFDNAVYQAYDARQKRQLHSLQQLNREWRHALPSNARDEQAARYQAYLKKEFGKSSKAFDYENLYAARFNQLRKTTLKAKEKKHNRHTIQNLWKATDHFWKECCKQDDKFASLAPFISQQATIKDLALYSALKKEQMWVQLEGILGREIPVNLLAKLHAPHKLSIAEKRHLKSFVNSLNCHQSKIDVKEFWTILTETMHLIRLQGSAPTTLQDIVYALDQAGCALVRRKDIDQLNWRKQLKEGDSVVCNGKTLKLGKPLPGKLVKDRYQVFELQDYPHAVIQIPHNRFAALIRDRRRKTESDHWGVRFMRTISNLETEKHQPKVSGLDSKGRCVVVEKLHSPFDQQNWASTDPQLAEGDVRPALVFANHLFFWQRMSPQKVRLSDLLWDEQGVLRSKRCFKKGLFDYLSLEKLAIEAAKGNCHILRFLMHVSKLRSHPVATYYQGGVEHVLKTGKTANVGRLLPPKYSKDDVHEHLEKLCKKAKKIRKSSLEIAEAVMCERGLYKKSQRRAIEKAVVHQLLAIYQASSTPGKLSKRQFKREIQTYFENYPPQEVPASPDFDAQEYYQTMHDQMMQYNRAVLNQKKVKKKRK